MMKAKTILTYFLLYCFSAIFYSAKAQNEPYQGGNGDGYAVNKTGNDFIYTYPTIHTGGNGDGFAVKIMGDETIFQYPNLFGGGNTDGYASTDLECTYNVTVKEDNVAGCLKWAIACALDGDTIKLFTTLIGDTIWITDEKLHMQKDLVFISEGEAQVLASSNRSPLVQIPSGLSLELKNIILALYKENGTLIYNEGELKLEELILKLSDPETGIYLNNQNSGRVFLKDKVSMKLKIP